MLSVIGWYITPNMLSNAIVGTIRVINIKIVIVMILHQEEFPPSCFDVEN